MPASVPVVPFADAPASENRRRLADLPDRVVDADPHHVTQLQFESPDQKLVAGILTALRAPSAFLQP